LDDRKKPAPDLGKKLSAPTGAENTLARPILVGRFGAPHGIRGEVRLQSFTQDPSAIRKLSPLTDASGQRTFSLTALKPLRDAILIAQVSGISDRNGAETLKHVELYVDRAKFPKAAKDEFYLSDLIGLAAFLASGELAGSVLNVLNFGAGDILEIKPEAGDTLLIPFTLANVPDIDVPNGRIVISPPTEVEAVPPNGHDDGD
jgi:16S rRNA processing protein RimM